MPNKLKKYDDAAAEKQPDLVPPVASGVACDEPKCKGEMGYPQPAKRHPELPGLTRAVCGECGWVGWC